MLWFPECHQVFYQKNKSYWNSLFIGMTAPIILLPKLIYINVLEPLVIGIYDLFHSIIQVQLFGIMGLVTTSNITVEQFFQEPPDNLIESETEQDEDDNA